MKFDILDKQNQLELEQKKIELER